MFMSAMVRLLLRGERWNVLFHEAIAGLNRIISPFTERKYSYHWHCTNSIHYLFYITPLMKCKNRFEFVIDSFYFAKSNCTSTLEQDAKAFVQLTAYIFFVFLASTSSKSSRQVVFRTFCTVQQCSWNGKIYSASRGSNRPTNWPGINEVLYNSYCSLMTI